MSDLLSMKSYAQRLNDMTFTDYYNRLKMLAMSVFKWENLPNNINERWIEKFLFNEGKCVIYEDDKRGLMVAECNPDGELNNYEEPTTVSPCGIDIEHSVLTPGVNCVLIQNNDSLIPTKHPVKLFAYRLAEITRTIDINIHAQKTPVMILTNDKGKLTVKNIYRQWGGNEPVIVGDKNIDPEFFKVLKTDAPIVFPQLQVYKHDMWNECLTYLGIKNANTEKRERLITDEVTANNEHVDLSAECFLKSRERAAEEINRIFGTNITVRARKESEQECMQDIQNFSGI